MRHLTKNTPRERTAARSTPSAARDEFAAFVCEQLADLPGLRCRAMFGGHGLYRGDRFFGIVWRGSLYFKTSPATVAPYLAADMGWFQPNAKQALKNYREVPARIIERRADLLAWARVAAET